MPTAGVAVRWPKMRAFFDGEITAMYEIIDDEGATPIQIFGAAKFDKRGRAWHRTCAADDISQHIGIFFYARASEPRDKT
jgi:hypothetical protein